MGIQPGEPNYDPSATSEVIKIWGRLKHADKTILLQDGDLDPGGDPSDNALAHNNWPDPGNNHKTAGGNIGFGDGHVAFVKRGPEWVRTWLDGYQGMAWSNPTVTLPKQLPGLVITGSGAKGSPYTYSMN
jgi:prepilin-type processing-associated H-X9-DG protein